MIAQARAGLVYKDGEGDTVASVSADAVTARVLRAHRVHTARACAVAAASGPDAAEDVAMSVDAEAGGLIEAGAIGDLHAMAERARARAKVGL